jgi:hypothetical protein
MAAASGGGRRSARASVEVLLRCVRPSTAAVRIAGAGKMSVCGMDVGASASCVALARKR